MEDAENMILMKGIVWGNEVYEKAIDVIQGASQDKPESMSERSISAFLRIISDFMLLKCEDRVDDIYQSALKIAEATHEKRPELITIDVINALSKFLSTANNCFDFTTIKTYKVAAKLLVNIGIKKKEFLPKAVATLIHNLASAYASPFLAEVSADAYLYLISLVHNLPWKDKSITEEYLKFQELIKSRGFNLPKEWWKVLPLRSLMYLGFASFLRENQPNLWDEDLIFKNRTNLYRSLSWIAAAVTRNYKEMQDTLRGIKVKDAAIIPLFMDICGFFFHLKENEILKKTKALWGTPLIKKDLVYTKTILIFFFNVEMGKIGLQLAQAIFNSIQTEDKKALKNTFRYLNILDALPKEYMEEYQPLITAERIDFRKERDKVIELLKAKLVEQLKLNKEEARILEDSLSQSPQYWLSNKFYEYILVQAGFFAAEGRKVLKALILSLIPKDDGEQLEVREARHCQAMRKAGFSEEFIKAWRKDIFIPIEVGVKLKEVKISYQGLYQNLTQHLGISSIEDMDTWFVTDKEEIKSELEAVKQALKEILIALSKDRSPFQAEVIQAIGFVGSSRAKGIFDREVFITLQNLLPSKKKEGKHSSIRFTNDPSLFMRSGLEPERTCMRPTDNSGANKKGELINRILCARFKLAQYWVGESVAIRSFLEVTLGNAQDKKPVLLVETIRSSANIPVNRALFKEKIVEYARQLGVETIFWFSQPENTNIKTKLKPLPQTIPVAGALWRDHFKEAGQSYPATELKEEEGPSVSSPVMKVTIEGSSSPETFPVDADALPDAPQVKVDVRVRFDKQGKARIVLTPDKGLDNLHQTALEEALAYAFNEQSKEDKLHWFDETDGQFTILLHGDKDKAASTKGGYTRLSWQDFISQEFLNLVMFDEAGHHLYPKKPAKVHRILRDKILVDRKCKDMLRKVLTNPESGLHAREGEWFAQLIFPSKKERAAHGISPQEASSAKRLREFIHKTAEELRQFTQPLKTIGPFITFFGSSRIPEGDPAFIFTQELAAMFSGAGFSIVTGGGPSIMYAANKGALPGKMSIGLGIKLPQ
ncbi:MAG: hypothetical protein WA066_02390, partial [Candidatus Omnitrophota bacterium]